MIAPTAKQLELHAFMLEYQAEHGMPPTISELKTRFGFASTNTVSDYLKALVKKGLVRHRPRVPRAYLALQLQEPAA